MPKKLRRPENVKFVKKNKKLIFCMFGFKVYTQKKVVHLYKAEICSYYHSIRQNIVGIVVSKMFEVDS